MFVLRLPLLFILLIVAGFSVLIKAQTAHEYSCAMHSGTVFGDDVTNEDNSLNSCRVSCWINGQEKQVNAVDFSFCREGGEGLCNEGQCMHF